MKISEKWLRSWTNPSISRAELMYQLNMAGLEVAAATPAAKTFKQVIVGKITAVTAHPQGDKLSVCTVNIGKGDPLTIICAASNVREEQLVPVAVSGAELPNHPVIEIAQIQNIVSQGMICSQADLGLAETSEGIWELPANIPLGADLWQLLQLDDYVFDIELTPNRGDCLSVAGLAREISVLNHSSVTPPQNKHPIKTQITDVFPVQILAANDCPHYVGRIIHQVNNKIKTPLWMQEYLRRSGQRSINPVVDVMNYVMFELGQPLHAFDLAKIRAPIQVRRANVGETLLLLNDQQITLDENILVIADAKQAIALAGVMGGADTAVNETTTEIFIECAYFNPLVVAGRARRFGLFSDGAYRFERGVDPQLQLTAIERVTELLTEIMQCQAGPVSECTEKEYLPQTQTITLRNSRLQRVLGITVPEQEVMRILQQLGMQVTAQTEVLLNDKQINLQNNEAQQGKLATKLNNGWQVVVPSYRFDISREIDLIEEVARIYGYQQIPHHRPVLPLNFVAQPEQQLPLERLRHLLVDSGYQEVITYSFVAKTLQELLEPSQQALELTNPLSPELAVMRTMLWPGLLNTYIYNQNRQIARSRLFETGLRFVQREGKLQQEMVVSGLLAGNAFPEQWGIAARPVDFFDMKNDLTALFELTGKKDECVFLAQQHSALHPGQSAVIRIADQDVGYCGALHPVIGKTLGITGTVYLFECRLEFLTQSKLPQFKVISKFPAIRRDLALIIDEAISAQDIQKAIKASAGSHLVALQLFDVYQGKGIAVGKKSIAVGLIFQHADRTLVESEVSEQVERVLQTLIQKFNVILRE